MKVKKIIITVLAFLAIAIALFGVWQLQKKISDQPTRQDREIRQ